jgi:hypothetical protein
MRATGNVEQDPVGRVDSGQRRAALAPVGESFEQRLIAPAILRHDIEVRMHGAGLRQRKPGREPEPFRGGVDRHQLLDIAAPGRDDEGFACLAPLRGLG